MGLAFDTIVTVDWSGGNANGALAVWLSLYGSQIAAMAPEPLAQILSVPNTPEGWIFGGPA